VEVDKEGIMLGLLGTQAGGGGNAAAAAAAAEKGNCFGPECFRIACTICAAASLASVVLTAVLCMRTAHVYGFHRRRILVARRSTVIGPL